jgi:hypothetical protein
MSRKFESLFPHLNDMDDEQLRNHIADIRRRKYIERPAKAKHAAKAEAPAKKRTATKTIKLLSAMSEADRLELIKLLEGAGDD